MRDVEQSHMLSYGFALGDYSLEPDGEFVTSIIDNVDVFLMVLVDLRSLRHRQTGLGSSVVGRKGRLLRRRSCLGAYLQSVNRESEFLAGLGTVATNSPDNLTGRF